MSNRSKRIARGVVDICPYCKKEVEVVLGKIYQKKTYHLDCYFKLIQEITTVEQQSVSESESKLYKYVARLFALSSISVKLKQEIQDYLDKGMTYDSLYLTLHYVYDILQWDFPSYFSYPTLKVIDYKYDEAMDFWDKKALLEEKSKEYDFEHNITVVHGKPRQNKGQKQEKTIELIDLEDMVTQLEQQEQLEKEKIKMEELQNKEMKKFNQETLSIQKEFEDTRLPGE